MVMSDDHHGNGDDVDANHRDHMGLNQSDLHQAS